MTGPDFDSIKHLNPYNVEYWQARELMPLLGYAAKWQNFESVIKKAMISCEQTGNIVTDHFTDANKMIATGKGAHRQIKDYYLSRLACYLIAMNGDPRKEEIATAQQYFAVSTRAHEIHQLRQEQETRIEIRLQVAEGNKNLSEAAAQAGVRSASSLKIAVGPEISSCAAKSNRRTRIPCSKLVIIINHMCIALWRAKWDNILLANDLVITH